jgi:hypothetical protein
MLTIEALIPPAKFFQHHYYLKESIDEKMFGDLKEWHTG